MSYISNGTMNESCICDRCKTVIHTECRQGSDDSLTELMERMYEYCHPFKDLNRGHECRGCKGSREYAYDQYVTSDNYPSGCSCYINPPCSYCTREMEEEE